MMLTAGAAAQQIPLYSTYVFNKILINPAFTGIDNEYRIFGFYRTQWASLPGRPVTTGATAEGSFWNDRVGAGINITDDRTGIFDQTNICFDYAQKIKLAKDHQLSIGIQGAALVNRIDFTGVQVKDLSDPRVGMGKLVKTVFDMNVGVGYKWKNLLLGFCVPNLLQPNAAYATPGNSYSNYEYVRHLCAYAGYRITMLHEKFNITPCVLLRTTFANTPQLDASATIDYNSIVFAGGGYRSDFGATVLGGVNILKMFTISYAYDFTTQPVLSGQVGSTQEITAGFHIGSNYLSKKKAEQAMAKARQIAEALQKSNDSLSMQLKSSEIASDSVAQMDEAKKEAYNELKRRDDSLQAENRKLQAAVMPAITANQQRKTNPAPFSPRASAVAADDETAGQTFRLDRIYFKRYQYELLPPSKEQMDTLVNFLKHYLKVRIIINGYTDARGTDELNANLSELRAKSVADYLIANGVDPSRIAYQGYGKSNPIDDNDTDQGRQRNRRVEFTIVR
jgi:type IX secretion system PorP/SprF family membrane protein